MSPTPLRPTARSRRLLAGAALGATLLGAASVPFFNAPLSAQETLTADGIVRRALDTDTMGFQTGEVTMTLRIQDASGGARERNLSIRGMSEDGLQRALVRVTGPAEVAGQSYLFRENEGDDDVYVFLPALDDAPRRISGSQKNGAFLGSHLTYSDFEQRDIEEATYTQLPDEEIGGFPVWVIDAVPDADVSSDYARVRLWVRKTDNIPLRIRFFDGAGETLKTLFTEQTDTTSTGRVYVRQLTLRMPDNSATTVIIDSLNEGADVSATEFTPQNLAN